MQEKNVVWLVHHVNTMSLKFDFQLNGMKINNAKRIRKDCDFLCDGGYDFEEFDGVSKSV